MSSRFNVKTARQKGPCIAPPLPSCAKCCTEGTLSLVYAFGLLSDSSDSSATLAATIQYPPPSALQAEFSSGTSATLVVSSRQQGDGGSQNGQGLGMSSGQGQALGASSGQGLGASSGQGIGSGQGMGSGPGNSRHGQFGAGSGSSSSTAAVPTPSGHAQTTGHTHASQQQQAQEWQVCVMAFQRSIYAYGRMKGAST